MTVFDVNSWLTALASLSSLGVLVYFLWSFYWSRRKALAVERIDRASRATVLVVRDVQLRLARLEGLVSGLKK